MSDDIEEQTKAPEVIDQADGQSSDPAPEGDAPAADEPATE